jgi:hypothetical protein
MAMVPDSECNTPTLMVSAADAVVASTMALAAIAARRLVLTKLIDFSCLIATSRLRRQLHADANHCREQTWASLGAGRPRNIVGGLPGAGAKDASAR